jgi:hypothetical protein
MSVLALTIFVTLALVCFFLVMFVMSVMEGKSGPQDALLPLEVDSNEPVKEALK